MALTANREVSRYVDQELRTQPVAASTHLYKGALVGIDRATGHVRNLVAGDTFAGIAYEEVDNSDGAGGAKVARVYTQGDFVLPVNNATQALVGSPAYALDSELTGIVPAIGASYCGILVAYLGTNLGVVRIAALAGPQIERELQVPLASSTSAATINPVMVTQRAIKVLSVQASFNTVPDAGVLDVGTDNSDPDELIDAFALSSLTPNTPEQLGLNFADFAAGVRLWAKVGQATSTAGTAGMLSIRYIELP